jgi:serine/threonine protein kinase
MCPEILNGHTYSTKSDVWSIGIIIYQMLYGKTPHRASSLEELVHKVNKKVIRFPQRLNNEKLQIILERMLQYDPAERISWK